MTTDIDDRSLVARVLKGMSDQLAAPHREAGVEEFVPDMRTVDMPADIPDGPQDEPFEDVPEEHAHERSSRSGYAWGGYQNGRIPTKALKAIGQGSHRLETAAADAWVAMREAAAKDGIRLALTDSYRSYDAQVAVRRRKGHQVATATPGTSVHGWGRAVDANVNDPATLRWLRANGHRFGWVNPAWAQRAGKSFEPWHYEFVGVA